jgi:hypothetical protein
MQVREQIDNRPQAQRSVTRDFLKQGSFKKKQYMATIQKNRLLKKTSRDMRCACCAPPPA